MSKTILITGSSDGIGQGAAQALLKEGHQVLFHGRNQAKLDHIKSELGDPTKAEFYRADLSSFQDTAALATAILTKHKSLDVLINNAGILKTANPITNDGYDIRFMVNTIAPYLLTTRLLPALSPSSRIVNLSSAAQAPVSIDALWGKARLDDMAAYSQSKLAITSWSKSLHRALRPNSPSIISVNPGSLLATNMVHTSFGLDGNDPNIGINILLRASLDDTFANIEGDYYDNDNQRFAPPQYAEAFDPDTATKLQSNLDKIIAKSGI